MSWYLFFKLLHILAAIFAFGPNLVFPLIANMGQAEPQHGNFGLRLSEKIEDRLVIPLALTMPVTGVLMIWQGDINVLAHGWLIAGIVLYVIAMTFALAVQRPTVMKMTHMTSHMPAPAMAAGPGAAPAGPPPEFLALGRRAQFGGMFLLLMVLVIVSLMVLKPGG